MSKNKKVYVIWGGDGNARWLEPLGFTPTSNYEAADLALFTGGEDIAPSFYNELPGRCTYTNRERDKTELIAYNYFKERGVPFVGICRGGQLLTAMAGGKLVQDSNHPGSHIIHTYDGQELRTNSLHHQQFLVEPSITGLVEGEDFKIIAWTNKLSKYHLDQYDQDYNFPADYKEPEIAIYPKIKGFAIQWHPEMMDVESPAVQYTLEQLKLFLEGKL